MLATAIAVAVGPSAATDDAAGAGDPLAAVRRALTAEFDGLLRDPNAYAETVRRQCRGFPEGDLFPYVLPACAYANLALAEKDHAPAARTRMAALIDLARPSVVRRVRPPGGNLSRLTDYGSQAVYLGQFNLALGCWRLAGGDERFAAEHKGISDALHKALVRANGRPLNSYPDMSWPFDTVPCLLSLRLYDRSTGQRRSDEGIARHLKWTQDHATDKATGLPRSRLGADAMAPPRGCVLSWQVCLVRDLDPSYARRMYDQYVKSFWLDHGVVAGFAEWAGGRSQRQDLDSGPVIEGVGAAASTFGLAAAAAMGDADRLARLARQASGGKALLKLLIARDPAARARLTLGGKIDPDSGYYTGLLFGDACLFYAATWRSWAR